MINVTFAENEQVLFVLYHHRAEILTVMGVAMCIALTGIVCGAMNFVGSSIHYPTFILALWFVADLLLMIGVLVHIVVGISAFVDFDDSDDIGGFFAMLFVFCGLGLGLTWYLLAAKHFAWLSLILFLLLTTLTVLDVWAIYKMQED
jgi:hypothetical protein